MTPPIRRYLPDALIAHVHDMWNSGGAPKGVCVCDAEAKSDGPLGRMPHMYYCRAEELPDTKGER